MIKTIVKKAKKLLATADDGSKECKIYNDGFLDGAEWGYKEAMREIANTWISVEKELPEDALITEYGLISGYDILVKFPNGSIRLADRKYSGDHSGYVWRDKNNEVLFNVAHWRPIE